MNYWKKMAATALLLLPFTVAAATAQEGSTPHQPQGAGTGEKAAVAEAPEKPDGSDLLLTVNGTKITRLDVERAITVLLAKSSATDPLPPEGVQAAAEQALGQLVAAELLYQEGVKTLNIKDLDQQVAKRIAENRERVGSPEEFDKFLAELKMTPKDVEEFTRKEIVISTLIEERFHGKAQVSDEEARKFYDNNLEKFFTVPEKVRASHILVGVEKGAPEAERGKAREKGEALLKKLKGGEDFAALAKQESSCPSSASGGDLGTFGRGEMVLPFEEAAFKLKPGETSPLVETDFGVHIIKVTERHEKKVQEYEAVKGKIVEYLKQEKAQQALLVFIEELRKKAKIEKF